MQIKKEHISNTLIHKFNLYDNLLNDLPLDYLLRYPLLACEVFEANIAPIMN